MRNTVCAFFLMAVCISSNASPSSDCSKADTAVERSICSNVELSRLDKRLAEVYQPLASSERDKQRAWLRQINACEADINCLMDRYQERLVALVSEADAVPSASAKFGGNVNKLPEVTQYERYKLVRKKLIDSGWSPVKQTESCGYFCSELRKTGWSETWNCAATGLAPCVFVFSKGNQTLKVQTVGEEEPVFQRFVTDDLNLIAPVFDRSGYWVRKTEFLNLADRSPSCMNTLGWVGSDVAGVINYIRIQPDGYSMYYRWKESSALSSRTMRNKTPQNVSQDILTKDISLVSKINNITKKDEVFIFDLTLNALNNSQVQYQFTYNPAKRNLVAKGTCNFCNGCNENQIAACNLGRFYVPKEKDTEYFWCEGEVPDDYPRRMKNALKGAPSNTVEYPNGDFYSGSIFNQVPQGFGTYWFSNSGKLLTTEWKAGKPVEGAIATLKMSRGPLVNNPEVAGVIKNGEFRP